MKKAIYDDDSFYHAYAEMPQSKGGLEAAGEWHQVQPLFPDLLGKTVLDLGCGYGWHCRYAVQMGASVVLGIDNSDKRPLYWPIDNYYYPGERETVFLGRRVLEQHHTLTQILNPLLQTGFHRTAVEEATPSKEMLRIAGMGDEMHRPMMLLVKAEKA